VQWKSPENSLEKQNNDQKKLFEMSNKFKFPEFVMKKVLELNSWIQLT